MTLERPDEVLEVRLAGGAGYGDPRERPLALIRHDLAQGYVTPQGVSEDYGGRVTADGLVVPTAGVPPPDGPA